jgi:hypothetical protein
MANTIKLKRGSGSDPGASDLVVGEIAIRTDTGKLFTKKDNGSVAEISGSGGGGGNNFKINTLSSSSGTGGGSATFNGTAYRFTLSDPPGTSCAQCLVSVNGVIQKPTTGTSQPSEGFAIDGSDILFSAAPASGADYFIITYDALSVTEVSDNSVEEGDLKISNAGSNGQFLQKQSGNTGGLTWATVDLSSKLNLTGGTLTGVLTVNRVINATNSADPWLKGVNSSNTETSYIKPDGTGYFAGTVTANLFHGSGANLTNLHASNLATGTIAEARLSTATTQSAGNNSTKIATTAYVETAVSNLVDSAPGALNTLNELAAALGDDANFSTTVTNSIATKLPLAGGTLTGDVTFQGATSGRDVLWDKSGNIFHFKDNAGAQFGDSTDLKIFHDGSNSQIREEGTGNLMLISNNQIRLEKASPGEAIASFNVDGACELYYDNALKLSTASGGVNVAGNLNMNGADNYELRLGAGNDLKLYHDGTNSVIDNNTGDLYVNSTGGIYLCPKDSEAGVYVRADGAVELYYDGTKQSETYSSGIQLVNDLKLYDSKVIRLGSLSPYGDFKLYHNGTNSFIDNVTGILHIRVNNTENAVVAVPNAEVALYHNEVKKFQTASDGIDVFGDVDLAAGHLFVEDSYKLHCGTHNDLTVYHNGSNSIISNTTGYLNIDSNGGVLYLDGSNVNIRVGSSGSEENAIICNNNGAVELYHNNNKRLETVAEGVKISTPHNQLITLSGSNDPYILFQEGTTNKGWLQWHSSGYFILKNSEDGSALRLKDAIDFQTGDGTYHSVWHAGNDGSGSGLDADTLDGVQGSNFLRSDSADTASGAITFTHSSLQLSSHYYMGYYSGTTNYIHLYPTGNSGSASTTNIRAWNGSSADTFQITGGSATGLKWRGNTIWTAENDGSGSGLDSDTCDGQHLGTSSSPTFNNIYSNDWLRNNASNHGLYNTSTTQHFYSSHDDHWNIAGGGSANALLFRDEHNGTLRGYVYANSSSEIGFLNSGGNWTIQCNSSRNTNFWGHIYPSANATHDIGSSSNRWNNLYVNDLQLSNKGSQNSVDGTWGDWTLQEGEEDVFMINNRSGKKYRMALQEVS